MKKLVVKKTKTPQNKLFKTYLLNDEGITRAQSLASLFDNFYNDVEKIMGGPSREASIVATKLEEACFFAKKAMAQNFTEN